MAAVLSLVGATTVAIILGLQAKEESARAVASRDFMLNLFKQADREKSRGASMTARDLLERGRADAMQRLSRAPRLQAELLEGIASVQLDMGEYAHADSTFAEVVRIYDRLDMPREAALATAAHANAAMRGGNLRLAETLLLQAKTLPARSSNDHELNARLTEVEGWIAYLQNDAGRARSLFHESRMHALAVFGPHHARTLETVRGLVHAEWKLRHYDSALALMGELEVTAKRAPDIAPKDLIAVAVDRAELLYESGRYAETLRYLTTAIPDCQRSVGPNDELCLRLLMPKVRALLRLGMAQGAHTDASRLEALADDKTSPTLQIDALLNLLRLESMLGPSDRQRVLLERVQVLGVSGPEVPVNPALKSLALVALAEAKLMAGDAEQAERWIEKVIATLDNGEVSVPILSAVAKSLRGVCLLQRGNAEKALQWLKAGHEEMSTARGTDHPMTQLFALNLATALHATGRTAAARDIVVHAETVLQQSLGTDAPTFVRVQRLKQRLFQSPVGATAATQPPESSSAGTKQLTRLDFFS
jgi:serine/threonine-protein kinase